MHFESLGLSPALLRALADQGYNEPTPIQAAAIPVVLEGHDLLASAQTGTGKTAGFSLPMLERLFPNGKRPTSGRPRKPRALVLTPTRELAAQVHDSVRDYSKFLTVYSTTIFGGVGMGNQIQNLRRGVDIVIATPGRLIDHMQQRHIDLSGIEILVLDEADRMLDMGFLPALKRVISAMPQQRQTLLFSATFAPAIKALASQFMHNPKEVEVARANTVVATVSHRVHPVDAERKRDLLLHILAEDSRRQTLVFARTKHGSDKLCKFLNQSGMRSAAIHGNKSQNQRTRALGDFKKGKVDVLVATDIAARGLDIEQLPMVINHDLPMVAEDYVHRIGRTGRAGASGLAVSLVSHEESGLLRDIKKLLKDEIDIAPMEGFEPSQPLRMDAGAPKPRQGGQRQRPNGNKSSHQRRPHTQERKSGGSTQAQAQAQAKRRRRGGSRTRRSPNA
ncbi:DEAD/DEAH box helicase [Oleiagrimonas sp. MCCC 1A03011]|uniref:DEAD/DEAH box helicase n=1 Tax=Oleiagrimonas sp. MCCC 1A03011 TaxID=1926883 RepID=UPI000DC41BFB|nr:DEAD/DEAH box helicase [Oleiagrimonas sp. MCCC 1A03011]RAP58285.1 RNA helicase [Oleiagrimonas sp. MCCC 1A03011]